MVMLNKEQRAKILEKLQKLMEFTDVSGKRTINENELALANRKIKEITSEYGITLEEIKNAEGLEKENLIEMIPVNFESAKPGKWVGVLSVVISEFYECKCIRSGNQQCFIGFNLDVEVCAEVFQRVYKLIISAAKIQSPLNYFDFGFGAVLSLRSRLNEIKAEREKNIVGTGRDLIIVKEDAVKEKFKKLFPNTTKGSQVKYRRTEDFYKGLEYGKTVEIFKGVEGDTKSQVQKPVSTGGKITVKKDEPTRKVYVIKRKKTES